MRNMGYLTRSMLNNNIKLLIYTKSLEMVYWAIGKGSGHIRYELVHCLYITTRQFKHFFLE